MNADHTPRFAAALATVVLFIFTSPGEAQSIFTEDFDGFTAPAGNFSLADDFSSDENRADGAWSYRLPTAIEWDKMARGTDARRHPWGDTIAPVPLLNLGLGPVAVDSHLELASPYGLLHMETNVSEWVEDAFDASGVRRVVKGGSWSQYGDALRTEARVGSPATRRSPVVGFRVVAEPSR